MNEFLDQHLCFMIEKGLNLEEYFQSNLPMVKIEDASYPSLHPDDSTLIVGFNPPVRRADNSEALFKLAMDKDQEAMLKLSNFSSAELELIFGWVEEQRRKERQAPIEEFREMLRVNRMIHLSLSKVCRPNYACYEDMYEATFAPHVNSQPDSQALSQVEYFVINMPDTLSQDPKLLVSTLNAAQRLELYDKPAI